MVVPDDLAEAADRLARQRGTSRDELCARALREYVERHDADGITEAINRAIEEIAAHGDSDDTTPFVRAAAAATLGRSEW